MFDRETSVLSSQVETRHPSPSEYGHSDGFGSYDQQTFAASNTLCALKHSQQPASFQPHMASYQDDASFYGQPSYASFQDMVCDERQAWTQPCFPAATPYQTGMWAFGTGNSTANDIVPSPQYPVLPTRSVQQLGIGPSMMLYPTDGPPPTSAIEEDHASSLTSFSGRHFNLSESSARSEPALGSPGSQLASSTYEDSNDIITMVDSSTNSDERVTDIPYAKLIHRALLDAKENRLVLKDIYKWIEDNTDKAKDPTFKGWRNSVRHNLSMNGAFTKVPLPSPTNKFQKGYMWVLEPSAMEHGIQSTTRYRRKDETKRSGKKSAVTMQRQRSGRKGGHASQRLAKLRKHLERNGKNEVQHILKHENPSSDDWSNSNSSTQECAGQEPFISKKRDQAFPPTPPSSMASTFSDNSTQCHDPSFEYGGLAIGLPFDDPNPTLSPCTTFNNNSKYDPPGFYL